MIGPIDKIRQDTWLSCERCGVVKSKRLGGTQKFPKVWMNHYCSHSDLSPHKVAYLKHYPETPRWCPALQQKSGSS
jgi:hypothetical protein